MVDIIENKSVVLAFVVKKKQDKKKLNSTLIQSTLGVRTVDVKKTFFRAALPPL